jgi:hypothetical protein
VPFDGSGTFARLRSWINDAAAGIKIKSDFHDQNDDDLAAGLTNCLTKDGQTQPTANLPMNGKKLVNLGDPTADSDAANKKYVDALKAFSKGLEISGADNFGRLGFTSTSGVNGLSFTGADLGWFAKLADTSATPPKLNRLVLNDKPDGSGTDVIVCNDDGSMTVISATALQFIIKTLTGNDVLRFQGPNAEDRMVIYTGADTETSGFLRMKGSVSFEFKVNGQFKAPGAVYAGNAYLNTDGNIGGGGVWANWGANDAYSAINARIEARANERGQAWANDRVANLQYRRTSQGASGVPGWGTYDVPPGTVCTGMSVDNYKWQTMRYHYLQVYDPVRGWVGFQG